MRDRNREPDRHGAPRARLERIHDDQRRARREDDHDAEHRDERRDTGDRSDLLARHLAERLAVAAHGRCEDDEVLNRAAEHDADDDPDGAGQIAELRGERGPDERAGAGDRREMVAEDDPAIRRHEVAPVVEPLRRRRTLGVEREDLGGDQLAVEAVGDGIAADARR